MIDFKALAELYELEAEAFAIHYDDYMRPVQALISFAGIITRMESDIIQYEIKNGREKTTEQNERISHLKDIFKNINSLSIQNEILKFHLKNNNERMFKLEQENILLKKTLQSNEKAWKQE